MQGEGTLLQVIKQQEVEKGKAEGCRLSVQDTLTGQRLCQSSSHNDAVLAALNQQRSDGILCDITLIAGEQKFHAHKAVLAACSDYFRAMFSLCMVESGADEVHLHGITSIGLKQALDFAYTGQVLLEPGVIQDVRRRDLSLCLVTLNVISKSLLHPGPSVRTGWPPSAM
ncbi:Kelch-like protein 32 [Varanus komodoensis]|nr:Kelch-like protein 32 [Varanus komodoensis]